MSQESSQKLYSKDGVDVHEEALFSSFAGSICKSSYNNSPFVEVHDLSGGNFRGPRPFSLNSLPEGYIIEASTDGIGTKGPLIDAAKFHHLAAYDLVAMTASDITRYGGVPLVLINALDTVNVGEEGDEVSETYKSAISGLGKVAKEAKIVVLKGETAQMGVCVGSDDVQSKTKLNWTGTIIGAYHKDKMITGDTLAEGQIVIALKENGFRSNGISAVRKALSKKFGPEWYKNPAGSESVRAAAAPSVLYDLFVNTLHGWYDADFEPEIKIHAIVHLSGGAIKEKLAKDMLFPRGLSAKLDDLWEPPAIMKQCAEWRGIIDEEFYEVWNGGQGMLLVVSQNEAEYCIKRAKDFKIEAKIAGKIEKIPTPQVVIKSKLNLGKEIIYT